MTDLSTADAVRERLRDLVAPMREQRDLVQSEVTQLEARLGELRSIRTELDRAIRTITGEPTRNANGTPRKSPSAKKGSAGTVSTAKVDASLEWLLEHRKDFPEGITAKLVRAHSDYSIYGAQSQVSAVLFVLRERGQLVLDRVSTTGEKVYKLVA